METCLVSVIIPAYNVEKYLNATMKSVMKQNFHDFEVIIINDGSTDSTQKIIDNYVSSYPDIVRSYQQENKGQSAARNKGVGYANGKYIAFVDSDDILDKDYLQNLYNAAEKENAEIAVCGYKKFLSESKKVVYSRNPVDWDIEFNGRIHHIFQYSPWGKIFLTEFLREHHFVFSEGEQLEDGPYGVMTHIVANKVIALDYYGYKYRIHEKSTMGNVRKKQSKPKVPYNGIEDAIQKVMEYKNDKETYQVLEYCIIKVLAGLTTSMYKNCDKETRINVCKFCYRIIGKYFPEVKKNPYIRVFKLRKLPFVHRMAVTLFVKAYQFKIIYPFSVIVCKVI